MRIGIDARLYSEAGIGRYIRNLISNLQKIDQENEYFIFLLKKDFENLKFNKNFNKILADFRWYGFAEQRRLPGLLKKQNLDLVHFPHFNIPIFYSGSFVVTIHDLIHQKFAMKRATTLHPVVYKLKHHAYNLAFQTALKKSKKVITVSDYVKQELEKEWNVKDEKIVVTKEGAEEELIKKIDKLSEKSGKEVLDKFSIKPPYIFYIGNAHPHKNVEGLIKSFLILRERYQYLQLVLGGHDHYFWQRIKKEYSGQKNIIFTGFVSDDELAALYKFAQVFVMPSFEEGFGIPLLEAMAAETPVVCSKTSSLPEVAGNAAIFFDPKNTDDMVEKISLVLNDQKLRKELVEKGSKRVKDFSWMKLAEETLGVYEKEGNSVVIQ